MKFNDANFDETFQSFLDLKRDTNNDVDTLVSEIISEVRVRGDDALTDYTKSFDHYNLSNENMSLNKLQIDAGYANCRKSTLDALELAYERIKSFHEKQLPENIKYTDSAGVSLKYRWNAIDSVGLYVPGGRASYPSSLLMNAVPALVAGVPRLALCVPSPEGVVSPLILAAAKICSIDEIYCIGGAQAVAALAYGTKTIEPVCKIVGPGNSYVASAKRQVFGDVGIDNIAGPSEILVVSDKNNNPDWIAIDLLSQAEHDPCAQAILVADDESFVDRVVECINTRLTALKRKEIASASWENFGAIIIVNDFSEALPLINELAPEHIEIALEDPNDFASNVRNAGSIFLGTNTPEAFGDYMAGPNHVLPTSRSARFSSGLGVLDFMKRTSMIQCNKKSLDTLGPSVIELAEAEGLEAHALSIAMRLKN